MKPKGHPGGHPGESSGPRLVAWETTRNCNLSCVHCRAAAERGPYAGELSTDEGRALIDALARTGSPILIMTGGEPLLRPDIFTLARHARDKGLRAVMAVNGTLVTPEIAREMAGAGIARISVSLDGPDPETHDRFRGVPGAFEGALSGIENAKAAGIEFQINTTITQLNFGLIEKIQDLAVRIGAAAHHIFLLVPTGRGKYILDQAINADQYEEALTWFYNQRDKTPMALKATCAPHYYRILRQKAREEGKEVSFETHGLDAVTRGCLAGTGFAFVSHVGRVQPCGFLDVEAGDVRRQPFDEIWKSSPVFNRLRDLGCLTGKCKACEYRRVCGGCRARAFEATGDFMAEEPLCSYLPAGY
ncbi:MAG: heme b synthase [Thermodesulfobacteriota bacterium]